MCVDQFAHNWGCNKIDKRGLPERGSQRSPVVPHGSVDGTNRWETVNRQPQSTRGGPEAAPSSRVDLLVSYSAASVLAGARRRADR